MKIWMWIQTLTLLVNNCGSICLDKRRGSHFDPLTNLNVQLIIYNYSVNLIVKKHFNREIDFLKTQE